jgi:hypothetical protein
MNMDAMVLDGVKTTCGMPGACTRPCQWFLLLTHDCPQVLQASQLMVLQP